MVLSKNIVTGSLLACFFLFLVQLHPLAYIAHEVGFTVLVGLCIWVVCRVDHDKTPLNAPVIFAILFIIYGFLSLLWSDVPYASFSQFSTYMVVPIIIISFYQRADLINFDFVYRVLMVTTCVLGVYALYQFHFQTGHFRIIANEPFVNPNSLAVFLGVGALIGYWNCMRVQSWRWFFIYSAVFLTCYAGIMTTSSRGVLLALPVMMVAMILFLNTNHKIIKLMSVFIAMAMVFFTVPMLSSADIISQTTNTDLASIGSRFNIWKGVVNAIILENPFFGTGIGTFKDVYVHYRLPADYASGLHAHNDALQLILELGIVGFIPVLILGFGVIGIVYQSIKRKNQAPILPLCLLAFMAGCAMFTTILAVPCFLVFVGFVIVDCTRHIDRHFKVPHINTRYFICCTAIVMLGLSWQSGVDHHIRNMIKNSAEKSGLNAFRDHINMLEGATFGLHPAVPIFQTSLLMTLMDSNILNDANEDILKELDGYVTQAQSRNPYNVEVDYYKGEIAMRRGDEDAAMHHWRQALAVDPSYIQARFRVYERLNKSDGYQLLKEGLGLKYWKQNPRRLYGEIMVLASEFGDDDAYQIAQKKLQRLLAK
jgi:O-antigen ligase